MSATRLSLSPARSSLIAGVAVVLGVLLASAAPGADVSAEIVALINEARQQAGLAALRTDERLQQAARAHTDRMVAADTLSHRLPDEPPLAAAGPANDRLDAVKYRWTRAAENVASGQTTPRDVVSSWMQSREHRANILDPNLRDVGVAHGTSKAGTPYWTAVFGRP